jgi:ligand-binding sensor domain-containing protein/signal transduction histidine kinase
MTRCLAIFLTLFSWLLFTFASQAQDVAQANGHNLIVHNWSLDNGMPSNSVRKIGKTNQGLLFIASYDGIALFDGSHFINYNKGNLSFLSNDNIYDFITDSESNFWIACQQGVFVFDGHRFFVPEGLRGLSDKAVECIELDQKGVLWMGTTANGLYRFDGKTLEKIAALPDLDKGILSLLHVDSKNHLWIGTESGGLYHYNGTIYSKIKGSEAANGFFAVIERTDGRLLFGSRNGIFEYSGNKLSLYSSSPSSVNDLASDHNGRIWAASNSGLFYLSNQNQQFVEYKKHPAIQGNIIQTVFFDNQNLMWIGTYRKGLMQVRVGGFENYPFGELDETPSSIIELSDGRILVSTDEGNVYELINGQYNKLHFRTSLKGGRIKTLYEDSKKNLLVCSYMGLLKISGNNEVLYDKNHGFTDATIRDIVETSDGYWMSTRQSGLHKLDRQFRIIRTIDTSNGLSSNFVMSISKGRNGKIWVATKNGIDLLFDDKIVQHYGVAHGLAEDLVYTVYENPKGTVWMTTLQGLSILKNETFYLYNTSNGLIDNKIFDAVPDAFGNLWLPTAEGLIRVKVSDLDSIYVPGKHIPSVIYGKTDGLFDSQYVGATRLCKLRDGRIALNTISGVSILDPAVVDLYKPQKSLLVRKILADNQPFYADTSAISIPSSPKLIQINYSFIDFVSASKVILEYKLLPFDDDWHMASPDNMARYTNLPAADYQFCIRARDISGKRIVAEKTIRFTIEPAFYQSFWFTLLGLLGILGLLRLLYLLRVRTLKSQKKMLEDEVIARTKEITQQKEAIEEHLEELEAQKNEIDFKNEEILIATNNLEHSYLNLKILSELGQEITSFLHVEQIVNFAYNNIHSLMDADIVGIGNYEADKQKYRLISPYYRGKRLADIETSVHADNCLLSYAISTGQEILTNDLKNDYPEFTTTFPRLASFKGVLSLICIPIKLKNRVTGILTVQSFRRNSYSDYHFSLLRNLAVYIRIALENSKNYHQVNQQKEELLLANATKDKLFSIIGHDLRGPVGTIKSFLDVLIENPDLANSEDTLTIWQTMHSSLGSAYTLLDNLLVWARNQRGLIEFVPEILPLHELVEESISLVNESSKNKDITISTDFQCLDYAFGDRMMVTTILRNLISNAVKFTPSNGNVCIRIKEHSRSGPNEKEQVEILVIDDGIGVKEEDIARILQPHTIFTTEGTFREQGSGLGISICIDFLKKHNKELNIRQNTGTDDSPKDGTTFSFLLDKADKIPTISS